MAGAYWARIKGTPTAIAARLLQAQEHGPCASRLRNFGPCRGHEEVKISASKLQATTARPFRCQLFHAVPTTRSYDQELKMAPVSSKRADKSQTSRSSSISSGSKARPKSKATKNAASAGQVKTKRPAPSASAHERRDKKKRRAYSDEELGLPSLNTVTPAGVEKPRGRKKGKVFVDDAFSMRTIFALVSADREGQIESKMQKARQMEEIREARRAEMEQKEQSKLQKLEEVKGGLRKKRNHKGRSTEGEIDTNVLRGVGKKRVAFG